MASASIIRREVESILNEDARIFSRVTAAGTTSDVGHSPQGLVGRVVGPQFGSCGGFKGVEINGVAHKNTHVLTRSTMAAACSAVDVSDLPRRAVASGSVDEVWCEVNISVVGPRVVFWVVFKRTWRHRTDGDVDCR